jgi:N utilization substance protein B
MGRRRQARECALQILFQMDFNQAEPHESCELYWQEHAYPTEVKDFAERLVNGVWRNRTEIDALIAKYSTNWRLDRMPAVDRAILRIATYEILFEPEIATSVTLNEAIEIAKQYGTEESGSFVNGVLDPIARAFEVDKKP